MGRRSGFSSWQGDTYTGVAEIGRVKSTMNLVIAVPICIILVIASAYMFKHPEEIKDAAKKACEKEQERLKKKPVYNRTPEEQRKVDEDCSEEPGGVFWGSVLLTTAAVGIVASYFNYKMSKSSKSYAAFQGGMAISNVLSPGRRY